MTEKEKIKKFLDSQGISKNKFYQTTGFGVGFLDSGNSLGVDKLKIIINKYPELSLRWLVLDEGEMLSSNSAKESVQDDAWMKNVIQDQAATLNRLSAKLEQLEKEKGMQGKHARESASFAPSHINL